MIKGLIKFILFFIIILLTLIIYLSFFGINTKKFNDKINNEVLKVNKKINLELKSVKFLLNPINFSINVKTFDPKVIINDNKLELENIKTNISLKSFINREFSIDDLKISTRAIKINNLILLARSFKNSPELFILNNIIKEGFLVGDINLSFDKNGKIKNNYEVKGFVKKGKLDILRKYNVNNLNFIFNIKERKYFLQEIEGSLNKIDISASSINVVEKNNKFFFDGKMVSKKNNINIKQLKDLLGINYSKLNLKDLSFSSNNDFTFEIDKKFKISNFHLKSSIKLSNLVYENNLKEIRDYLPNFKKLIKLENHKVLINYKKDYLGIEGEGEVVIEDKKDKLYYKIHKKKNTYDFNVDLNIDQNPILIKFLNYEKKKESNSSLKLQGIYINKKKINFKSIFFEEKKNKLEIKNLNLNDRYKILSIDYLKLDYVNKKEIINQINIKKEKKNYKIYGNSFDISKLIDEILIGENDKDKESFSIFENLNNSFNVEINKTYLNKDSFINKLSGDIKFKNNKIKNLNLRSSPSNKDKLTLTIKTNENNEKITTFFTATPKPFVERYKFIEGFENGILDFYSIEKNDVSKSILTIDNFKIKKVPVFAKLLSLASLQGIADLLTGEGIRFNNFEMKFSNTKKLMTIEELYSIGPAVSVLMEGYLEKNGLISLRGTLVPATTINKTIASIPLIGSILVGKKSGEGVFGVSFKIKGPPKNLNTTVNPIKTLTPRFITRTLEKIKKN